MCPPSLLVLATHLKPLYLCSIVLRTISLMAAMHLWELCTEVKGDSWGGRAIHSTVLCNAAVGGGWRVGGCRIVKATNYKRWGWDWSSDVRMLFKGDLARLGHPFHVEMLNKQGECVLKIRCCICRTLISYHKSSWTYAATHIWSHNITIAQDIVVANPLVSESEAKGEPLPYPQATNSTCSEEGAAGDVALIWRTFVAPSYGPDMQPLQLDQANNWEVDRCKLPSIQDSGDTHI